MEWPKLSASLRSSRNGICLAVSARKSPSTLAGETDHPFEFAPPFFWPSRDSEFGIPLQLAQFRLSGRVCLPDLSLFWLAVPVPRHCEEPSHQSVLTRLQRKKAHSL